MMRGRLGWRDGCRGLGSGVYDTMTCMSNSVLLNHRCDKSVSFLYSKLAGC